MKISGLGLIVLWVMYVLAILCIATLVVLTLLDKKPGTTMVNNMVAGRK